MTKYFKLLGIALLATSLAFVSCGDDGDDTTDPGTGTNPPAGEVTPGIKVTFGDQAWEATESQISYYAQDGVASIFAGLADAEFPQIQMAVLAEAEGTVTDEIAVQNVNLVDSTGATVGTATIIGVGYQNQKIEWCEYYNAKSLPLDVYGTPYGDWWAKTVTFNVTALDLTKNTISATVTANMFEVEAVVQDFVKDGVTYYPCVDSQSFASTQTTAMTVEITNMSMTAAKGSLKK